MKNYYRLFITSVFMAPLFLSQAQTLVGTFPTNKIAVVEKFTGVKCGPCATPILHDILDSHPDEVIAAEMHPDNTSLTDPWGSDPDLGRDFPIELTYMPYFGNTSIGYPSGHINRRPWGGDRRVSANNWPISCEVIYNEVSPMNIGLSSDYDTTTKMLDVTVEVYYTQEITDQQAINVYLTETGIITEQTGYGPGYRHRNTFREALTAQWGDTITQATPQGTLLTLNFSYDNSTTNYDMDSCHVMAFVWDFTESFTGNRCEANGGFTVAGTKELENSYSINVFPNPASNFLHITTQENLKDIALIDVTGKVIANQFTNNGNQYTIDVAEFPTGLYFIKTTNAKGDIQTHKFLKE